MISKDNRIQKQGLPNVSKHSRIQKQGLPNVSKHSRIQTLGLSGCTCGEMQEPLSILTLSEFPGTDARKRGLPPRMAGQSPVRPATEALAQNA